MSAPRPMPVFVPAQHARHRPDKDLSDGFPPIDHLESPVRIARLLEGIARGPAHQVVEVRDEALAAVQRLHDADYVAFLLELQASLGAHQQYIPAVFRRDLARAPLAARGGMFCQETGTPIGSESISAALNSAGTALAAMERVLASGDTCLALCRPPGHHAGRRRYGGYCFFNNAYLAATRACELGKRVVVVDLDYHLGDGSVEFACAQAPYFSLHADPLENYPYLDAATDFALPHTTLRTFPSGIHGREYLVLAERLLADAAATQPDVAIISMGFDTLGTDYIQDHYIYLEPADYTHVAARLRARLMVPLLVVLEGGYDAQNLAACAQRFFAGLISLTDNP